MHLNLSIGLDIGLNTRCGGKDMKPSSMLGSVFCCQTNAQLSCLTKCTHVNDAEAIQVTKHWG